MLKSIRESRGLSRKEVSERSGINFRSLQDYEQGHKNIASAKGETLYRLSLTLGCSMEELMSENSIEHMKYADSRKRYLQAYSDLMEKYFPWKEEVDAFGNEKNLKTYYLMHRNDIVTVLAFDEVSGNIIHIGKRVNEELLPPGGNLSGADLKSWWMRRAVPAEQGNVQVLLRENQIPTTQNYLLMNLGLSLSDHYWVNPVDKFYKWEDVNLFTNDFRDEIGNYYFYDSFSDRNKVMNLKNRTIFYPSGSQQGELQKKWVVQNGKRYLIKANHGTHSQQSINEVIATLIHEKQQRIPFVKYSLCDIDNSSRRGIGCVCEDFCTVEIEFIPAYDVVNSMKKRKDISVYDHFIYVCQRNGLEETEVREFLEYQIMTDFLLSNTDRHLYNFGVLRDSRTLKFVGMAPVFDSGNSMFWNQKYVPEGQDVLDITVNSFLTREVELLKYVKNPFVLDLEKLPSVEEIRELLELDGDCKMRSKQILEIYKIKMDLLETFQNGKMIYKYGYKI